MVLTVLLLTADLALKYWAFAHVAGVPISLTRENAADPATVPLHEPTVLLPHLLNLQLTVNTGAVFGLFKGNQTLFIVISIVAIVGIGYAFIRSAAGAWLWHVSLAMILAGALGNLYDRWLYNGVRDMLHMLPSTGLWPWIFNIADAVLMVGSLLMMVLMIREDLKLARDKRAQTSPPAAN